MGLGAPAMRAQQVPIESPPQIITRRLLRNYHSFLEVSSAVVGCPVHGSSLSAPLPGLREWASPQIVVSGGQNNVRRFSTDSLTGFAGQVRVDVATPSDLLTCQQPAAPLLNPETVTASSSQLTWTLPAVNRPSRVQAQLGLPPRGTPTPPEPIQPEPKAVAFNRFTTRHTDSGIASLHGGLLMRVQLAGASRCGIDAEGKPIAVNDTTVLLVQTSGDCGDTWTTAPIFPSAVTSSTKLSGFDGAAIYYHAQSDRVYVATRSGGETVVLGAPATPASGTRAQDYVWSTTLVFAPGDNNPSMTSVPTAGALGGLGLPPRDTPVNHPEPHEPTPHASTVNDERLFLFCCAEVDGKDSPRLLIVENPASFKGSSPTVHTIKLEGLPVPATAQSGAGVLPPSEIPGSKEPGSPWNAVPLLSGRLVNQLHTGSVVPLALTKSDADGSQHKLRVLYPSVIGPWQVANVVDLVVQVQPNGVVVTGVLDHRVISRPGSHVLYAQLIPTEGLYGIVDHEFAFRHVLHWTEVEGKQTVIASARAEGRSWSETPTQETPALLYQGPPSEVLKPTHGGSVRPLPPVPEPRSAVRILVDCWLPDPVPAGRWTGSQVVGDYKLNRSVFGNEDPLWFGDYRFGTFVDAGSKTRFFVPWTETSETSYYLKGSMVSF